MVVLDQPGRTGEREQPDQTWSTAEAKARFSELLHEVEASGPQFITRRGAKVAVVISAEEWHRKTKRTGSLAEFFTNSPLAGSELDLSRGDTRPREVEL